ARSPASQLRLVVFLPRDAPRPSRSVRACRSAPARPAIASEPSLPSTRLHTSQSGGLDKACSRAPWSHIFLLVCIIAPGCVFIAVLITFQSLMYRHGLC
ncbi:uncharacterized protein B0I36DRAFT_311454, partial [Microdochium trichocladiopsis]